MGIRVFLNVYNYISNTCYLRSKSVITLILDCMLLVFFFLPASPVSFAAISLVTVLTCTTKQSANGDDYLCPPTVYMHVTIHMPSVNLQIKTGPLRTLDIQYTI